VKIEAVRKFHFCSGHRVLGHESKCANMHGHNYILWVHAEAPSLDQLGRVIDFSVLKEKIDPWIQEKWDHTFLISEQDSELKKLEPLAPKKKAWFICPFNPTAENMGKYLLEIVIPELLSGTGVRVNQIELQETENCKVILRLK